MSGFSDIPESLCLFDPNPSAPTFHKVTLSLQFANDECVKQRYKQFVALAGKQPDIERQLFSVQRQVKQAKSISQLQRDEKSVFEHHKFLLENYRPLLTYSNCSISKRVLNYFVVVYAKEHKVCYYLDKTRWPFEVIGDIGSSLGELPADKQLTACYVDLYLHYKESKEKRMRRLVGMSPYARGPVVNHKNVMYPLSEMQFMWWFAQVGGMSAFNRLQDKVLESKFQFEKKQT